MDIPTVSVDDVKKSIDEKEVCVILDVRTKEEVARGGIPGSIHLPVDQIEKDILSVIPDTKTKVYVYCLSGSRSIHAVEVMINHGYINVFDVSHGLLAWRIKKYPLVIQPSP